MRFFNNFFILYSFLIISCTPSINREDVCGQWFYKSAKIYLYQDGTGYITNIRGFLPVPDYIPDTFACKWEIEDKNKWWEIEDKKITINGIYTFEIYIKDKNELYVYNGDPDEFDIFSFKRIQNKE